MRKKIDTLLLIFLLIGPAVILTCVRQSDEKEKIASEKISETDNNLDTINLYAKADMPRP